MALTVSKKQTLHSILALVHGGDEACGCWPRCLFNSPSEHSAPDQVLRRGRGEGKSEQHLKVRVSWEGGRSSSLGSDELDQKDIDDTLCIETKANTSS